MKYGFILFLLISIPFELFCQTCIKGDCKNGFGSCYYSNGGRYTGEFQLAKRTEKGIYYYANQNKYLGEWRNDLREGEGKLIFRNGDVYSGNFKADKMEGYGVMEFGSKDRYDGNWKLNKPSGKGTYYFAAGDRYEGDFVDARFEGEGTMFYRNGAKYVGQWKQSKKHGYGELITKEGKSIVAQWEADKPLKVLDESPAIAKDEVIVQQKPEETKKDEISQTPVIKDTVLESKINQQEAEKPIVQNEAKPQNPACDPEEKLPNCNTSYCADGKGIFYYSDGSKYVGQFELGEPHGKGICFYANGDRYDGYWDKHAPHGEGTMYFVSGLTYVALWDHGKVQKQLSRKQEFRLNPNIEVDQNPEVKIWAVVVGIARYEHMRSLKYSDDDAYRIYAFLKSPEGGALKDEQIRVLIDEDATRLKILQALNEVFLKADDNDVVMLYYSGHGLEGTFIPIDYDGTNNLISHEEIKDLLSRSKAKHKICYFDACYSGSLLAAKGPYSNSLLFFYDELDRTPGGTAFLMSSKNKEFSLEDGGLRQGIFSHFLIKGLKGQADTDLNKTITIKELFEYVYKNVREYTGNVQSPMIAGDYDEHMPVGFVRAD